MSGQENGRPLPEAPFRESVLSLLSISSLEKERLRASPKLWPVAGTQGAVVLLALARADGGWVGLDVLMRSARAAAVHSVVSSLRKRGWRIRNEQGELIERGGVTCRQSSYRLELDREGGQ